MRLGEENHDQRLEDKRRACGQREGDACELIPAHPAEPNEDLIAQMPLTWLIRTGMGAPG
jgi:hypothetical protein